MSLEDDLGAADTPIAVLVACPGGHPVVRRANPSWSVRFGADLDRVDPPSRRRLGEALIASVACRAPLQVEVDDDDGGPWLVRLAPSARGGGEVVAVGTDLADLRETIDGLWAAQAGPERVRRALVARASHELRTPLAAVLGTLDVIADPRLPELVRVGLDQIRAASSSLLRRVDALLEAGATDGARSVRPRRPVLLEDLLRGATEGSGLAVDLDPRLRVLPLRVDGLGLSRTLRHLLAWGTAVAVPGRVALRAGLSLVSGEDANLVVDLEVGGVQLDDPARLLLPFGGVEAHAVPGSPELRLGLAAAAGWAEGLGGRLAARPTVDGLRLVVDVPVAVVSRPAASPAFADDASLDRVLVVEDDRVVQRILSAMVARCGLEVLVVEDGASAVDAMVERAFPIVLMDVNLPVLDGISATRRIRDACGPWPYIVATTAHASVEDRRSCLRAGMDAFLPKPVRLDDVRAVLAAATLR